MSFFNITQVELQEFSGESYTTLVKSGYLSLCGGSNPTITVDDKPVPWVPSATQGPYKKVDKRSYQINTPDIMSHYYITLPKGLSEAEYEHFADCMEAMKDGKPFPKFTKASGDTGTAQQGAAHTKTGNTLGQVGALFKVIADKAAHDVNVVGSNMRQKAAHDRQLLQGQGHPEPELQPRPA